jgi:hypothetical protein
MGRGRTSFLMMSAVARLGLAALGCAVVWLAVAIAIA